MYCLTRNKQGADKLRKCTLKIVDTTVVSIIDTINSSCIRTNTA